MASKMDGMVRELMVGALIEMAEAKGWAVERVKDYGHVAVEVPVGETDSRWVVLGATLPKMVSKEGEALFDLDTMILEYESRVKADAEKERERAEKERVAQAKRDKAAAEKAAKAQSKD